MTHCFSSWSLFFYFFILFWLFLFNLQVAFPTRFELVLPPWKGDVLTAWPRSRICLFSLSSIAEINFFINKKLTPPTYGKRKDSRKSAVLSAPSRARTCNTAVNSRVLYHWAIKACTLYLQNWTPKRALGPAKNLRISFRPISTCQLNVLPHLHLTPIYLVLFKGSCDVSSWGGLHA